MNPESLSDGLWFDQQAGLWRAHHVSAVTYPADDNAACFRLEDGSFWFNHRNHCITAAVRRFDPGGFILDVGGGNGFVARALIDAGFEAVLLEPGLVGASNGRERRGLPTVINATMEDAAIRAGSVPSAGLFDVLEHIEDHRSFVDQLHTIVRPGGLLYLTVPAFTWLWSTSDVDAMHFRRYTRESLADVLAGRFDVIYGTYLFRRLVPAFFLARTLPYRLGLSRLKAPNYQAEHSSRNATMSATLMRLLASEVDAIQSGRSFNLGSSLLVVARRART